MEGDSVSRFAAFLPCSRPAIVTVSASRPKVGRHPAAMPPGGPRSSCCPIPASGAAKRSPPPRAADLVMAGGMPASTSQAPLLRQPRRHLPVHSFHRTATCRGATSLAASPAARSLGVPRAWPPSRTRPVCTARPSSASRRASSSRQVATAPSQTWSPHCASPRKSSSACRSCQAVTGGPARRVKNVPWESEKQLRFRAENTCIQQLIQQQELCSTIDTTVAVTGVGVLLHHQTRVRTSLSSHHDRLVVH